MQWTVAIGVDTHKDVHVAVALDGFGEQLGSHEVETTEAGYRSLLSWALGLGQPVFAVEGAGSYGAGLLFAAATGLRPSELFGLEWRDVDREAGVVYVRRAFANGRGRIDFRSFGRGHWKPAQRRAALRAGVPGICHLPVHGLEHRDDRLPLRPPRPRQPRARRLTSRRTCIRTRGGRWGGRRRQSLQRLFPKRFPGVVGADRAARWTLGGR